jgi:aspartyl-tRNA(Asn)/glutamyl-tRNA(Gln) amidotransferase subunit C
MSTDRIDIRYVAKLARLDLSEGEVATYGGQLTDFLTHVDALRELQTADVPATAQVIGARNVGRDDVVAPSLAQSEVLSEAPETYGAYFRVPRIIGGEE